ncbi:MAG TPA: tripartite tricarboxylate transporter substrate binding protein [Casimicrobiaceae bacterium]|jgi:tripartite-type tricarboxylate transporter receptor subunit TctC|nr:tripartite tricarboxylate transporter substrate binding protein [Casimicrobiaceae bacterium]
MSPNRHAVALGFAAALAAGLAHAQADWPGKPIRMIVPYPPGGGTDVVARIVNEKLSTELGQPIVIDNKGGAGGSVGTELAAKAPADGYTLLLTLSSHTINPKLYPKLGYDVERDFIPVSLAAQIPQILVAHPSVQANTVAELVALLKANPGKYNYASVGIGSPGHIAGELFKLRTGVQMTHVPYKGGGPAVTDTMGGQVQLLFVSMPAALQFVKAGRLKALAVTSSKRSASAPEVPTIAENGGPDVVVDSWYGVLVPAKTPQPIVAKLNATLARVLQMPDVREKLFAQGAEAVSSSSAEFDALIRDELKKWDYVIREAKITPE